MGKYYSCSFLPPQFNDSSLTFFVVVVSRELTSEIDKRKDVLLNACEENEQLQEKKLLGFFLLSFFQFRSQKLAVTILGSSKL